MRSGTKTKSFLHRFGTTLVASAAMLVAAPAGAQQQAGGNGRALDANLQVGSGGTNAQQNRLDFRVQNDVVTGNVGGGRAFRGDVGYQAPGEFRDSVGADDLFQFRRDATAVPPRGNLPRGVQDVGVYRPYTSEHALRPPSRPGQIVTSAPRTIGGRRPLGDRLDLGAFDGTRRFEISDTFDRVPLDDTTGRWLEVSASPLLGVRSDIRESDRFDTWRRAPDPLEDDDVFRQREEDVEIDRSLRRSSMLDLRANQLSAGVGTRDEDLTRRSRNAPSIIIGQQLRSQVLEGDRGQRADQGDDRVDRLEQQVFRPLQGVRSVEPGQDPYMDLLRSLDEQGRQGIESEGRPDNQDRQREEGPMGPFEMPQMPEPEPEAEPEADAGRQRLQELLDRLDHDLPPLETLAGQGNGRADELMAQGEQALQNERFFEAEGLYRQVVAQAGDKPLARVGLVHAQLGAGMIRSAAMNMRTLFEEHPELIATRYENQLLPPADRLDWLEGELRRMVEQPAQGPADAGLMLAYLGYQRGNGELIEEGLEAAEARDRHDALIPVLRRIWLNEGQP